MQRLLRVSGYRTRAFTSAEELLTGLLAETACLVLDVNLPGESGIELYRRLRRAGACPPTVFTTSRDIPGLAEAASRWGAVTLMKPCLGQELLAAVAAAIQTRARRASSDGEKGK